MDARLIKVIAGVSINEMPDGSVKYRAGAMIDVDGIGPKYHDPYAQNDTSLHHEGKPLNADVDRYIVVPPAIIHGVKGIVLGCQAYVVNSRTGLHTAAVVGDIGPHAKIGEMARSTAIAIGIKNPSPVSGGEEDHVIDYTIMPGVAALVEGKQYVLKSLPNVV
jgi:hypothetical protein